MNRRGDQKPPSGGAAAGLIGIITILIVFYIIFIPPEERRELLYGENDTAIDNDNDGRVEKTLLLANIGRLDYEAETSFDHTIPNVYLVATKNAQVVESFNPFIISNGWFADENKVLTFTIAQPELTSGVKLVLDAPVRKGILTVILNSRIVYEGRPESVNIQPIELKSNELKTTNTLEFSVSGVGLAFWRTNEYDFSSAQVIADITDREKQESANVITLESTESHNLKKATLTFYPICQQTAVGSLEVTVNNQRVSASTPDCESVNRIELEPSTLSAGRNTVFFSITKGAYRLEQIKVKTEIKESPNFIDYFDVNATTFDAVTDDEKDIILKITFVDDKENKRAELNINGKRDFIDQREAIYERNLNSYIVEDNNYLELIPKSTLNIAKLEVILE